MKKIIAVVLAAVVVITLFSFGMPVVAKDQPEGGKKVFEAEIVDIPRPGSDTLEKGEVCVRAHGGIKIRLNGVSPAGETYMVTIVSGPVDTPVVDFLGLITTDSNGDAVENSWSISGLKTGARFLFRRHIPGPPPPLEFASGFEIP